MFFSFFLFWFFFLKYLLTDLSFRNASKKVFVCQDKRDSQKDVKSNNRKLGKPQNSHTKIGPFILSRWISLVFLLHISFLILAFLCKQSVIDSQLKYLLSIIHDSFLFIALLKQ